MKKGLGKGLEALFSIYEEDENLNLETSQEIAKSEVKKEVQTETKVETKEEFINIKDADVDITKETYVTQEKKDPAVDISSNKVIPQVQTTATTPNFNANGVVEVSLKQIDPNKNQPRKTFDAEALKELAESIKQHGVIQPIIVNDENNGRYTIIAGERRYRASLVAGKTTIPAVVRTYSPKQIKEVALIENLQREDLNPIEAAKAIKELMLEYDFTQETVADRIGKSRPLVANTLRLLTLAPEVVAMIEKGQISAGHGKCLVAVEDKGKQVELAKIALENKLSVRDLENYIKNYKDAKSNKDTALQKDKIVQSIELKELGHRIARLFKTKVIIKGDDNKGKITIDYFNIDDLDRISNFIASLERK